MANIKSNRIDLAISGQLKLYRNTELSSSPVNLSSKLCMVFGWTLLNMNESTVYLKFYESANPVIGTTTPLAILPIPPGDGINPGVYIDDNNGVFRAFSALSIAVTSGIADTSEDSPALPIYSEIVWG